MSPENPPLILTTKRNGVSTLTMNMPKRFNGWTFEMMDALKGAFEQAASEDATKAVSYTHLTLPTICSV